MKQEKVTILGLTFNNLTKKKIVQELIHRVKLEEKTFVVTANPEIVMYAKTDLDYMAILNEADYITADGVGIIRASKILETPIVERVAGFDLMLDLLEEANNQKLKVYFLGATEDVLEKTIKKVQKNYPSINIAGSNNGYFDLSDQTIIKNVYSTNPDMIFVALGFPRQEKWIQQYLNISSKGLLMGVGGSFDVLSGKTRRAPIFFRKLQLEWFYRLIKQPSRIHRMTALPRFMREIRNEKHNNIN